MGVEKMSTDGVENSKGEFKEGTMSNRLAQPTFKGC